MDQIQAPFGRLLRHWRQQRHVSQLQLALLAEVSSRHLSWLETGKAQPSRAMVLRLAEQLDVPLRERNSLLAAAGFAPLFTALPLAHADMAPARAALQRLLDAHEPWPALAIDGHWNLVAHNRLVPLLLAALVPHWPHSPVNVLTLSLHPLGLAPFISNLPAWRAYVLGRLQRQARVSGDAQLLSLLAELRALPAPANLPDTASEPTWDVAVPLSLKTPLGPLNFITTITVFGAPHDITLAELAVETLLPADAATAAALQAFLLSVQHKH